MSRRPDAADVTAAGFVLGPFTTDPSSPAPSTTDPGAPP